jgi:hypothetical protein
VATKNFPARNITRRVLGSAHIVAPRRPDIVLITSEEKDVSLAPDSAIEGPAIPADDLVSWYSGGFGCDSQGGRKRTPINMLDAEEYTLPDVNAYRPVAFPKLTGNILVGLGLRRNTGDYLIDVRGAILRYDPSNGALAAHAAG